jgi:hypothetical protein
MAAMVRCVNMRLRFIHAFAREDDGESWHKRCLSLQATLSGITGQAPTCWLSGAFFVGSASCLLLNPNELDVVPRPKSMRYSRRVEIV